MAINPGTNTIIAKGHVKHTTGGPTMALVGFIHPIAVGIFEEIDDKLSAYQNKHLAEKICITKDKRIGFYPSVGSKTFYGHIWNCNRELNGFHSPNTYSSKFSCLVRYYDDNSKKFIYTVFSPLELEFV